MNINANMKSVHSITGIPGSKKKRLPKNSGVFLLVSDSHTLGFPNPERLRRSEVCRMDIYHIVYAAPCNFINSKCAILHLALIFLKDRQTYYV